MAHSIALVVVFSFFVSLALAQGTSSPNLHVATFAADVCEGAVQVYDTYPSGSCVQTGASQSIQFNCVSDSPFGVAFSNTSDCSISGDNTQQVDLSRCSNLYLGINSTSACDSSVLTAALGPNYLVRYYWGFDGAYCLNDSSLTVESQAVVSPVGLVGASQMALDTCSNYNGLQWNAYSLFPTIFPNNTMKIFLYSAVGCNENDFIGFLNPDHGVCSSGTISGGGPTATFYETWFSSTVLGTQNPVGAMPPGFPDFPPGFPDFPPGFPDFPPGSMPPGSMPPGSMPPMNAPPQGAAAPVAAPVAAAPVAAAPVANSTGPIAPPVRNGTAPLSNATQFQVALSFVIAGCLLALFV